MFYRLVVIVVMTFFLGSCATTQPTAVNQLQIKVAQLERKVDNQGEDLATLKSEMNDLLMGVDGEESLNYRPFQESETSVKLSDPVTLTPSKTVDTRIIRVSASIKEVQTALKNAGYYDDAIDGKLGNKSKTAIRTFQEEHDLQVDGIVGRKTWTAMKSYLSD